jgi:hypothetical protein
VLKIHSQELNGLIYQFVTKDFLRLSQLKFSSNVIEKCLELEQSHAHVEKVLKGVTEDQTIKAILGASSQLKQRIQVFVNQLAWDSYGNYVLQKVLNLKLDHALKQCILEEIRDRQGALNQTVCGQKML